jgi:hypothetical protein
MDMRNLNADETANLRCRIKDLERELAELCNCWELNLDSIEEEGSLDESQVKWSRLWIKEAREKWLKK